SLPKPSRWNGDGIQARTSVTSWREPTRKPVTDLDLKGAVMPVIKPRTTQKQFVRHITRLYRENNELLFAYAKFIGEPTEYVVNQLVETVLAKDKDFQVWRE